MEIARDEVGPINASLFWAYIPLSFAIIIIATFCLLLGHSPLRYDEANYLVLASAIRETGYPIWFWEPDKPTMFLNSPPGLLYLLNVFSAYVTNDVFLLRLAYSSAVIVLSFLALFIYIRAKGMDIIVLSVTAVFCAVSYSFFTVELVQVRMDLPLAALSFVVLVTAALAQSELKEHSERKVPLLKRRLCLTLALLVGVSALSFLTKFQAVCLTACLFLDVVLRRNSRRLASWLPLIAHIAGSVMGVLILILIIMSNPLVPGAAALHDSLANDLGRVAGPQFSFLFNGGGLVAAAKRVFPMVIVSAIVFGVVRGTIKTDWGGDQLFRLSVLMVVVVVGFNIAVHRMPGSGVNYMAQASIPLGYITALSFKSLFHAHQRWSVLILISALTLHARLNFQLQPFEPGRWESGLAIRPDWQLDEGKLVAANVAPFLRFDELLLLDGWEYQGREIPYWLNRSNRYGYLFSIDPIRAESLLDQKGPRRIGAFIFKGEESLARLRSREWSGVEALLARDFISTRVENAPGWTVYLRRND